MTKDSLYKSPRSPVPPFEFDDQVARVFDDMLRRSIPLYDEIIHRQVQMIQKFYQPGTRIYDLGCSNGNLGLRLYQSMGDIPFEMVAVDSSKAMLEAFEKRLNTLNSKPQIHLRQEDICKTHFTNVSVVVLNFTLQFIPPEQRRVLINRIYKGLVNGGALLFCEKISHNDRVITDLHQNVYYTFKRENGYSELEISQKREALENVLIAEPLEFHQKRLQQAGFETMDVWLKWFNFTALVAIK